MKIRTDYITNSSSSSFILAFKNDKLIESYDYFMEWCEAFDYNEFLSLIEHFKNDQDLTDKDTATTILHSYIRNKAIDTMIKKSDYKDSKDYYEALNSMRNSEEFNQKLEECIANNEEYLAKKKQIEDADLVVSGEIWDSQGGLLEWAIRNGFIEDNFKQVCVLSWNVG